MVSEAQAVALMGKLINGLVKERARAAALQLKLGFVLGLRLLFALGLVWLDVPSPLPFGCGFPGCIPDGMGAGGSFARTGRWRLRGGGVRRPARTVALAAPTLWCWARVSAAWR